MMPASSRLKAVSKLLAAALALAGLAAAPARAESVLRVAMTAGDIPDSTGQPDQGFEGFRFVGYNLYDALVLWDLSRSTDKAPTSSPASPPSGRSIPATTSAGSSSCARA